MARKSFRFANPCPGHVQFTYVRYSDIFNFVNGSNELIRDKKNHHDERIREKRLCILMFYAVLIDIRLNVHMKCVREACRTSQKCCRDLSYAFKKIRASSYDDISD